jgi:hypothetical protein
VKEITCPCCLKLVSMDETDLNSGNTIPCPSCGGTFKKARKTTIPNDDQYEIVQMGGNPPPTP